jgi:hypothetical protein
VKYKIKKLIPRRKQREELNSDAPRITNDTVAAHREEVLSSARKYILPLQHSKHRIVLISTGLFIALSVGFLTYCTLALYRFQSNSTFMYRVTQVVPFPIARFGSRFVSYENYLFELRHYVHYYETQVKVDFNDPKYKDQLVDYKKRALDKVINDAYVKELADKNNVPVSDREVDDQLELLRAQNRLGSGEKVFEDVLKDYWGWSLDDFKRSLRQELLAQKLVAALDSETKARADAALAEIKSGADFAAIAKKYSDDPATKEAGGDMGTLIDRTNRELSATVTNELFKLKPGEVSGIINNGAGFEVVKNLEANGDKIRVARIVFNFADINQFLNEIKDQQKARAYIKT